MKKNHIARRLTFGNWKELVFHTFLMNSNNENTETRHFHTGFLILGLISGHLIVREVENLTDGAKSIPIPYQWQKWQQAPRNIVVTSTIHQEEDTITIIITVVEKTTTRPRTAITHNNTSNMSHRTS